MPTQGWASPSAPLQRSCTSRVFIRSPKGADDIRDPAVDARMIAPIFPDFPIGAVATSEEPAVRFSRRGQRTRAAAAYRPRGIHSRIDSAGAVSSTIAETRRRTLTELFPGDTRYTPRSTPLGSPRAGLR